MNKAEPTDRDDDDDDARPAAAGPTYISAAGMQRLRHEHHQLLRIERPRIVRDVADAAAMGDRSENAEYIYGKRRLREIDKRLHFLEKRFELLTVVDPADQRVRDRAVFGATVTAEDQAGQQRTWTLVGPDEIDIASGRISYRSPIGAALLGKQVDDDVRVQTPAGLRTYCIIDVTFSGG